MSLNEALVLEHLKKRLSEVTKGQFYIRTGYTMRLKARDLPQPEADLVLCPQNCGMRFTPLIAAEVKCIRTRGPFVSHSYYSGLDEAIALLRLGFDYVFLVHVVEYGILEHGLMYPRTVSALIRDLGLPIGYIVYAVSVRGGKLRLYKRLGHDKELGSFWIGPRKNPLLDEGKILYKEVQGMRRSLVRDFKVYTFKEHKEG